VSLWKSNKSSAWASDIVVILTLRETNEIWKRVRLGHWLRKPQLRTSLDRTENRPRGLCGLRHHSWEEAPSRGVAERRAGARARNHNVKDLGSNAIVGVRLDVRGHNLDQL
jgi:hypothetical protein